jgi:hypothetical protein
MLDSVISGLDKTLASSFSNIATPTLNLLNFSLTT